MSSVAIDVRYKELVFKENIRLVIWDLDETFWSGTITEGGILYNKEYHDVVIELARRGIMSSICSKNDHGTVEALLKENNIWNYFIFPSIDWNPKAPRIKEQIEAIGLRPPTVLFIDDNWQNLHQALDLIPGINIAEPAIISQLLDHPQLKGKPDLDLTRLQQYKNNEKKFVEQKTSGSNIEFLRKSDIKVYFEYDLEKNIDRVIELINRTNQLNFTKSRLPEDVEEAKRQLLPFLRQAGTVAGLVRVVDRYGDYGFVGFFAMTELARTYTLKHYCFSCRTLNMYIEHFVYNFINRPVLNVVGDVLSDVHATQAADIDWIRALPIEQLESQSSSDAVRFNHVYARGGCDLAALMHYFSMNADRIDSEFNTIKNWQSLRLDHSSFLMAALSNLTDDQLAAAAKLGYDRDDFKTAFPQPDSDSDLILLSFWADADIPFYRHRATGLELPYWLIGTGKENYIVDDQAVDAHTNEFSRDRIYNHLRAEWDYCEGLSHVEMVARYRSIIARLPKQALIVMTLANNRDHRHFVDATTPTDKNKDAYNRAIEEAAQNYDNVKLVDFRRLVVGPDDILDMNHLRRDLYFNIYEDILSEARQHKANIATPNPN